MLFKRFRIFFSILKNLPPYRLALCQVFEQIWQNESEVMDFFAETHI